MNYTIKDLKGTNTGQEIKGLPLYIRTARGTFRDAEGVLFQEVRFMDKTGEITGHILQDESPPSEYQSHKTTNLPVGLWRSGQTLCVMDGVIQETDERRKEGVKIVISECFDTAVNLSYEQGQELQAEDWKQLRQDEIKGKIRHGLVCVARRDLGFKGPLSQMHKQIIKSDVEFIMTGE